MNQELIEALRKCAAACKGCAEECGKEINAEKLSTCIKLNMECADFCTQTASLITHGSDYDKKILQKCIQICNNCATECRRYDHMDHCKKCAALCEQCIMACLTTLSHLL